ncbi:MAG: thermonuclease family protein [Desulfobacterium sp.]|jgi:endonuclease YncB( thermonuclease family)|nr:thermonuclease family protein [Desulfobacterium sp.]
MRTLLFIFFCLSTTTSFALSFSGKVVKVSDGDAIQVMREGKAEKVRLAEIDCPETNQPFGQAAKRFTLDLAAHKIVTVEVETKDRYGRTVGEVILPDGSSLNRRIVEEGYAWWYRKYSEDNSLSELESKAQANKKGMWADKNPVAPWEWRRKKKTNSLRLINE